MDEGGGSKTHGLEAVSPGPDSLGDRTPAPGLRSQFPHLLNRDHKANLRA